LSLKNALWRWCWRSVLLSAEQGRSAALQVQVRRVACIQLVYIGAQENLFVRSCFISQHLAQSRWLCFDIHSIEFAQESVLTCWDRRIV
jgi:hypothetical protein